MPYVGYATIVINDYPILKLLVIAGMIVSVMITKDTDKS
jgi:hypothetical protein